MNGKLAKMTREELAAKVDWEGGVHEAIACYGLSPELLPEDTPAEVRDAWTIIYHSGDDADVIADWLYPSGPDLG